MYGYISLDDRDGEPVIFHEAAHATRRVQEAPGLAGGVKVRRNTTAKAFYHGSIDRSRNAGSMTPALRGWVRGSTEEEAWAEWDALAEVLAGAIDTPRMLRWQRGSTGPELQAAVQLVQIDGPDPKPQEPRLLRFQVQLESEDFRGYSQTLDVVEGNVLSAEAGGDTFTTGGGDVFADTFTASSGGDVTIVVGGAVPTPAIYRIHGGATNPRFVIEELDIELALDATINSTEYVDIDVLNRAVLLNGVTEHPEYIDTTASSAQRWADLPPGTWTGRLLAPTFDLTARVEVFTRDAYT